MKTHPDNWDEPFAEITETIEATELAETIESESMSTVESTETVETDVINNHPSEVTVGGLNETASGSAPLEIAQSNPNTVTDRHLSFIISFINLIFRSCFNQVLFCRDILSHDLFIRRN